jgi:hypothetical protein
VPERRWTAYSDVALASGSSSSRSVGVWLRNSGGTIPNYWRVLTVRGEVPDAFIGGGWGSTTGGSASEARLRCSRCIATSLFGGDPQAGSAGTVVLGHSFVADAVADRRRSWRESDLAAVPALRESRYVGRLRAPR